MDSIRPDTPAARFIAQHLRTEKFVLVDVGCSGGLDSGWRCFGDKLQAFGFDIFTEEVRRLNGIEDNPHVEYHAKYVGVPAGHPLRAQYDALDVWSREVKDSLSYVETIKIRDKSQYDTAEWVALELENPGFSAGSDGADQQNPADPIFIPDFLDEKGINSVDFIKIDVDGVDYIVLQSLEGIFGPMAVLGAALEVNYFGSDRHSENVFHNVDRLMRANDFGLFGLSVRTYSTAALPWPYALSYPYAAQSSRGRPYQGDTLYARDAAASETRSVVDALSAEKLAKLVAIFAVFNLPDQAADICIRYRTTLAPLLDVDALLDLLALQIQEEGGGQLTYLEYMARYRADDPAMYGAGLQYRLDRLTDRANETAKLEARVGGLSDEVTALQTKLETAYGALRALGLARPLGGGVKSFVAAYPSADALPATFGVPAQAWSWGAASAPLTVEAPSTLRLTGRVMSGEVGVCLMTSDFAERVSAQRSIAPGNGDCCVEFDLEPGPKPLCLALYNFGRDGEEGEIALSGIELITWPTSG